MGPTERSLQTCGLDIGECARVHCVDRDATFFVCMCLWCVCKRHSPTPSCKLLYGTNLSGVGIFVPSARPPRARAGSLQRSHWPRTASRARRRAFRRARFTGLRGARWRGFSPRVCEHAVGCARRRLSAGVNPSAIAIAFANQPGPAGAHARAQHGALNSPISRAQRGRERVATPTGTTGETTGAPTATRLTRVRGASVRGLSRGVH